MRSLLLLACLLSTFITAADTTPPATGTTPDLATLRAARLDWWRTQTVGCYRRDGRRDPAWDADVERLVEAALARLFKQETPMSSATILALAKDLTGTKRRCPDPIVPWAAFTAMRTRKYDGRDRLCSRAIAAWDGDTRERGAAGPRYPAILRLLCDDFQLRQFGRPADDETLRKAMMPARQVAEDLRAYLRSEAAAACPGEIFVRLMDLHVSHGTVGDLLVNAVDEAVATSPLPAWAQATARAVIRVESAWGHRGSGWADTVTEDGWKGFGSQLDMAASLLEKAWELHPSEYVICLRGITCASTHHGRTTADTWFRRGIQACFDAIPLYETRRNFLAPRWGGSYAALLTHGHEALATGRFDTEVPWEQIATVQQILKDARYMDTWPQARADLGRPATLADVHACLEGYRARHPERKTRYDAIEAAILWHALRLDEARTLLASIPATIRSGLEALAKDWYTDWSAILAGQRPIDGKETTVPTPQEAPF